MTLKSCCECEIKSVRAFIYRRSGDYYLQAVVSATKLFHLQSPVPGIISRLVGCIVCTISQRQISVVFFECCPGIISFEAGRLRFVFTLYFVMILVAVWHFRLPNTIGISGGRVIFRSRCFPFSSFTHKSRAVRFCSPPSGKHTLP